MILSGFIKHLNDNKIDSKIFAYGGVDLISASFVEAKRSTQFAALVQKTSVVFKFRCNLFHTT